MDKYLRSFIVNLDRCNQKCLFCMKVKDIQRMRRISYNTIIKEIIGAKNKGYTNIDFYGGEPTCFPFLKKAIRAANNHGLTVTLATNAVKFSSREYTDSFFSEIDIIGIRTSLHDIKPEIHDAITQVKGSFDKTIKGIANMLMHNRKLSVNMVINSLNYRSIAEMPEYIYKMGVRGIKFTGLVLHGDALANKWLNIEAEYFLPYLLGALKDARKLGFYYIEVEKMPSAIFKNKRLKFVNFLDER